MDRPGRYYGRLPGAPVSPTRRTLVLAALAATALPNQGCIGSFTLTRMVLDWNRSLGSIVVQEVVFLLLVVFQVYEVVVLFDAIILNVVEFATGTNPVSGAPVESREVALADGSTLTMTREGDALTAALEGPTPMTRRFSWTEHGAEARDGDGALLFRAEVDMLGGVAVSDGQGTLVAEYAPAEVEEAMARLQTHGPVHLAHALRGRHVAME